MVNKDGYDEEKTSILIFGDNFGCGSLREDNPWSINHVGIRYILSTSFRDIFYFNCFNNGMLPIILPLYQVEELLEDVYISGMELTVNLPN